MKFIAADGRDVDLAKLRGKVVLIDFWATWCGPCIAELPNVVANHEKFHASGFEAVGISLGNSDVRPTETPEQTATKPEAARAKLLAFTAARKMPWPQCFDGKCWKNEISTRFGIEGIPAMVLLDQCGEVISIDARRPKLETGLKCLLGM